MSDTRPVQVWCADVAAELAVHGLGSIKHYVGRKYLRENLSAPKFVWATLQDQPINEPPKGLPRSHYQFGEQIAIFCHGKDPSQAYEMRNAMLRALGKTQGWLSVKPLPSGWLDDHEERPHTNGSMYELQVQVATPVPDNYGPAIEVLGVEHEGVMGFASGDEPAC